MQLHKLTCSSSLRLSSSQEFRSACLKKVTHTHAHTHTQKSWHLGLLSEPKMSDKRTTHFLRMFYLVMSDHILQPQWRPLVSDCFSESLHTIGIGPLWECWALIGTDRTDRKKVIKNTWEKNHKTRLAVDIDKHVCWLPRGLYCNDSLSTS